MYFTIPEVAKVFRVSPSTIRNYMKDNECIKVLFTIREFKPKDVYKNRTYKEIVIDESNLGTLKEEIKKYDKERKFRKMKKRLFNISVRDCLKNDIDCSKCESINRLACNYFLRINEEPPIKKVAFEAIDKFGGTIG